MQKEMLMKVLIADDHALIRQGMVHALKDNSVAEIIIEANDKESVLAGLEQHADIDVVLLDLFMPGANDFDLLVKICNSYPDIPIIVVSAAEEPVYMRKSIDLGASGFIPKSSSMEIMLSAIQLVRSGGTYIPADMMQSRSNTDRRRTAQPAEMNMQAVEDNEIVVKAAEGLTKRQSQVLSHMAKGQANKEIARELGVSEHTVKIHVTAILRLFNASNRTEVVVKARNARVLPNN